MRPAPSAGASVRLSLLHTLRGAVFTFPAAILSALGIILGTIIVISAVLVAGPIVLRPVLTAVAAASFAAPGLALLLTAARFVQRLHRLIFRLAYCCAGGYYYCASGRHSADYPGGPDAHSGARHALRLPCGSGAGGREALSP